MAKKYEPAFQEILKKCGGDYNKARKIWSQHKTDLILKHFNGFKQIEDICDKYGIGIGWQDTLCVVDSGKKIIEMLFEQVLKEEIENRLQIEGLRLRKRTGLTSPNIFDWSQVKLKDQQNNNK